MLKSSIIYTKSVINDMSSQIVNKRYHKNNKVFTVCAFIFAFSLILFIYLKDTNFIIITSILLILDLIFVFFGEKVFLTFNNKMLLKNKYLLNLAVNYTFNEEIVWVTENLPDYTVLSENEIKYSDLYDIKYDKKYIYLYVNRFGFLMILREGFDTYEKSNEVIDLIKNKLKK